MKDQKAWDKWVETNDDAYGKMCVDVARRTMKILDGGGGFDTHRLIIQADEDVHGQSELTGFMAGMVANMISGCHERGDEFRRQWNIDNQIQVEGEVANMGKGVLNPALLEISDK